jgi:hypothetical protein
MQVSRPTLKTPRSQPCPFLRSQSCHLLRKSTLCHNPRNPNQCSIMPVQRMSKSVLEEGPQRNLRQNLQSPERRRRAISLVHDVDAVPRVCYNVGAGSQKQPGAQHEARVCHQLASFEIDLDGKSWPVHSFKLDVLCGEDELDLIPLTATG